MPVPRGRPPASTLDATAKLAALLGQPVTLPIAVDATSLGHVRRELDDINSGRYRP
jgi:hypothetical protein